MKRRFLLLILSLLIAALALPISASGYIADNADIIAEATEAVIARANATLADKNGASIHIYTDTSCGGDTEAFAHGLFESYELDERTVLLVILTEEEDYYLVRGAGLAEVLPEEEIAPLLEKHLESDFAEGKLDTGVRNTVSGLSSILNGVKKVDTSSLERAVFIIFIVLISAALILTVILFIMRAVNSRKARLRRRRRRPNRR